MTRRVSILKFLSIVFALGLLASLPVFAANDAAPTSSAATAASCGTTIAEQIAAARKALATSDARSEHAALACLIEATAALNERVRALDAGRTPSGMLHVPTSDFPVQPFRQ